MKIRRLLTEAVIIISAFSADVAIATQTERTSGSPDQVMKDLGLEAIRQVDGDICFPSTAEEYVGLGKNAIVMLTSSSVIATELPLRSVYALQNGVRIPLQRIAAFNKQFDERSGRTTQVSFYLMPIHLMKRDAQVLADFEGQRRGFGFFSFSASKGMDPSAPAFARLDEYDDPSDPDMAVVQAVLAREYPDHFQ